MKLVGRVPVEPLSDERMTNIERAIVAGAADAAAKGRARESRWPVFGFAMATIVLVIGAGFVGWKLRGGGEAAVVAERPLAIDTDAKSSTIDIGDAKITSDPSTKYTIARAGTGVTIAMTRGKVALDVVKRGGKDPLIVRAGDTDVEVVGTQFTVDYGDGTSGVDVRVTEGKVKVVRHQQAVFVAAGEAWQSERGVIALAEANTRLAHAGANRDAVVGTTDGKSDGKSGAKVDGKPDAKPGVAIDDIEIPTDGKVGLHDRTAVVPDAKLPTGGSGSAKSSVVQGGPENVRPRETSKSSSVDVNGVLAQPVVEPLNVHLDAPSSVSKYREMAARERGDDASIAFYSIAAVQHLKLGRNGDAAQTLEQYFRRFRPDAREYMAARWLEVRVKCLQWIDGKRWKLVLNDRCRQAAYTYAHEAPASPTRTFATALSVAP